MTTKDELDNEFLDSLEPVRTELARKLPTKLKGNEAMAMLSIGFTIPVSKESKELVIA